LWQSTRNDDQRVASAAFHALSKFPSSLFCINHFPIVIVDEIMKNKGADDKIVDVPGFVYVKLLHSIPSGTLAGLAF